MSPIRHALISLVVGLVYGYFFAPDILFSFMFVAFLSGTLIDVDHFVVGRFYHGDWRFLTSTFSSFWTSMSDVQSVIDESTDLPADYRLFSHSIIVVGLVSAGFVNSSLLVDAAVISAGFHLVSDLFADCFLW